MHKNHIIPNYIVSNRRYSFHLFQCLLVFASLFLATLSDAQSVNNLDIHNGFGTLQFSLSLKELKHIANLKRVKVPAYPQDDIYTIKNIKDFSIYGYPIQFINLWFYKTKLYQIEVKLQDQTDPGIAYGMRTDIKRKVWSEYGLETSCDSSYNTKWLHKSIYYYWSGREITLIQAWPWGDASFRQSNSPNYPTVFIEDTWFFISNRVANERKNELDANHGL